MMSSGVKNRPLRPGGDRLKVRPAASHDVADRWFNVKHRKETT
jgi:hypothetical protein